MKISQLEQLEHKNQRKNHTDFTYHCVQQFSVLLFFQPIQDNPTRTSLKIVLSFSNSRRKLFYNY